MENKKVLYIVGGLVAVAGVASIAIFSGSGNLFKGDLDLEEMNKMKGAMSEGIAAMSSDGGDASKPSLTPEEIAAAAQADADAKAKTDQAVAPDLDALAKSAQEAADAALAAQVAATDAAKKAAEFAAANPEDMAAADAAKVAEGKRVEAEKAAVEAVAKAAAAKADAEAALVAAAGVTSDINMNPAVATPAAGAEGVTKTEPVVTPINPYDQFPAKASCMLWNPNLDLAAPQTKYTDRDSGSTYVKSNIKKDFLSGVDPSPECTDTTWARLQSAFCSAHQGAHYDKALLMSYANQQNASFLSFGPGTDCPVSAPASKPAM